MSWEVRATDVELYAQFGERGPVFVMEPDGTVTEQLRPIDIIEPMVPLDEAIESVLDLIKYVELPMKARKLMGEILHVDPENVGTSPTSRPRSA